jgi:hypothetical protein
MSADGVTDVVKKPKRQPRAKTDEMRAWFSNFIQWHGDYMPHRDQIHLPSTSKMFLYYKYAAYMDHIQLEPAKTSHFYKEINDFCGDYIKIRQSSDFTKCGRCTMLTDKASKGSASRRAEYRMKLDQHHDSHALDRRKYMKHIRKSRRYPLRYMQLSIDGMDQHKCTIPRLKRATQKSAGLETIPISVIGVMCHGHAPKATAYILPGDFPKDSSLTCHIIAQSLLRALEANGKLPPVLYLQLDNTYRENKNTTVFAFCRWLVQMNIFKKVIIRLPRTIDTYVCLRY